MLEPATSLYLASVGYRSFREPTRLCYLHHQTRDDSLALFHHDIASLCAATLLNAWKFRRCIEGRSRLVGPSLPERLGRLAVSRPCHVQVVLNVSPVGPKPVTVVQIAWHAHLGVVGLASVLTHKSRICSKSRSTSLLTIRKDTGKQTNRSKRRK